jgi:hypothetical protein
LLFHAWNRPTANCKIKPKCPPVVLECKGFRQGSQWRSHRGFGKDVVLGRFLAEISLQITLEIEGHIQGSRLPLPSSTVMKWAQPKLRWQRRQAKRRKQARGKWLR